MSSKIEANVCPRRTLVEGRRRGSDAARPPPRQPRTDPQRGPARPGRPTGDRAPQRGFGAASEPGGAKPTRSCPCSGVPARDACASGRSATSGRRAWKGLAERCSGGDAARRGTRAPKGGPDGHAPGDRRREVAGRGLGGRFAPPGSRFRSCSAAGRPRNGSIPYREFVRTTGNGKEFPVAVARWSCLALHFRISGFVSRFG